ncbi:Zinc Finger Homeobox Protein 4 [Manis pentadactyla]|nr:Zinc Finger Homeobox Protein 4 [Manis pentadactyla]
MNKHEVSSMDKHEVSSMDKHEVSSMDKHEVSSMDKHEVSSMNKHEVSSMDKHEVSNMDKHEVSSMDKHEVSNMDKHEVSSMDKHEVSNMDKHEVSSMDKHEGARVTVLSYLMETQTGNYKNDDGSDEGSNAYKLKCMFEFTEREALYRMVSCKQSWKKCPDGIKSCETLAESRSQCALMTMRFLNWNELCKALCLTLPKCGLVCSDSV